MKIPVAKKAADLAEAGGGERAEELKLEAAKRANQRLRMIISRIKKVLDNIPHIAFVANTNGEDLYLNKKWHEYTGMPTEKGMGLRWTGIVCQEDMPSADIWSNPKNAEPIEFEYRIKNAEG